MLSEKEFELKIKCILEKINCILNEEIDSSDKEYAAQLISITSSISRNILKNVVENTIKVMGKYTAREVFEHIVSDSLALLETHH